MTPDSRISKKPLYTNEKVNANYVEKLLAHMYICTTFTFVSFNMFKVQKDFKDRDT